MKWMAIILALGLAGSACLVPAGDTGETEDDTGEAFEVTPFAENIGETSDELRRAPPELIAEAAREPVLGAIEIARTRTEYLPAPQWDVYVGEGALISHGESILVAVPKDGRGKPVRLWMQYFHVYGPLYFESLVKSGYLSLLDLAAISQRMKHPVGRVRLQDEIYWQAVDPFLEHADTHSKPLRMRATMGMEDWPTGPVSGGFCDYHSSPFCVDWLPPPPPPYGGPPPTPAGGGLGGTGGAPPNKPTPPPLMYCGGAGGAPVRSPAECPGGELDYSKPTQERLSQAVGDWLPATLRKTFGSVERCQEACWAPTVVATVAEEACVVPAVRTFGYGIPCLALGINIKTGWVGMMSGTCQLMCSRLFEEVKP